MKLKKQRLLLAGQGLLEQRNLTAAVKKASEYAFKELGLTKITAKNQPNQLLN